MNQDFADGVIWAAARIIEMHDNPVIAKDVINEASINEDEMRKGCEYDLEFLRGQIDQHVPKGKN